jgi:hypothetical protein
MEMREAHLATMPTPPADSFISIIQLSISPVILISGLGGLMITLTNRMARIVDRSRVLSGQVRGAAPEDRKHIESQLKIMWGRANLMRWSVTCAGASMLVACLLVGVVFLGALVGSSLAPALISLFALSILFLITSLILFLRDLFVSLVALGIEVKRSTGLE